MLVLMPEHRLTGSFCKIRSPDAHGKSKRIVVDGYPFSIDIFRLETDTTWTLEVVDHQNTSHVWDDQFKFDAEAWDVAVKTIEAKGALSFMRGNNVIPFRHG